MNTYGLTLEVCEGLIWAVRQEPTLWNRSWGTRGHVTNGDGKCCIMGAQIRHFGSLKMGPRDVAGCLPGIEFAEDWFYGMAKPHDRLVAGLWYGTCNGSSGLRWLTLGKLRLIHDHLADAAEQREEISRWAPAVTERAAAVGVQA